MKEIMNVLVEDHIEVSADAQLIDWEDLVFKLRDHEIAILAMVYLPEAHPVIYRHVYARLQRMNYSMKTARRKIQKLSQMGLIVTIRTVIGIINPVLDETMVKNIRVLVELHNRRTSDAYLPRDPKYDELLKLLGDANGES